MAIGEDDAAALVDDEAGGVAGAGGLGVEGATGGGAKDDDGGDDLVECSPPVLGGGHVLLHRRRIDLHTQFVGLHGGAAGGVQSVRSQPLLHLISHSSSVSVGTWLGFSEWMKLISTRSVSGSDIVCSESTATRTEVRSE